MYAKNIPNVSEERREVLLLQEVHQEQEALARETDMGTNAVIIAHEQPVETKGQILDLGLLFVQLDPHLIKLGAERLEILE
jgi:hypothetical protein